MSPSGPVEDINQQQLQQQQQSKLQPVALRALYTAIIFLGHFSGGIMTGVTSPTMVDLRYLLSNTEAKEAASMGEVSLLQTFLLIGCCTGGFISFLYDWSVTRRFLNRQLLTGFLYLITAGYFGLLPQISSLPLAYGLAAVGGIGLGNEVAIAVTWIIEMWSGRLLAAALQALQLAYGLGTIVGPLIVRPHLFGYMNATEVAEEVMSVAEYRRRVAQRRASLTGPFIISACFVGAVAIAYLALFFAYFTRYRRPSKPVATPSTESNYANKKEEKEEEKEEGEEVRLLERPENATQLRLFLALVIAIFACNNLAEVAYFSFQDTFLQALKGSGTAALGRISASEAAIIGSITATAYTAGRGANILVSMVLSPGRLLLLHYGLSVLGMGALFWTTSPQSLEETLVLKVNAAFIGYAFSAIMPAMFAFIDRYAVVNDRRNALFTVALTVPSIFTPLLIGNLIERVPQVMMYLDGGVLLAAMALFLGVRFLLIRRCKGKGKGKEEDKFEEI